MDLAKKTYDVKRITYNLILKRITYNLLHSNITNGDSKNGDMVLAGIDLVICVRYSIEVQANSY